LGASSSKEKKVGSEISSEGKVDDREVSWAVEVVLPKAKKEVVVATKHRIKESGPNKEIKAAKEEIAPVEISQREREL